MIQTNQSGLWPEDMRMSEFLIKHVAHEDIRYFFTQDEKGPIFIIDYEEQEERPHCKSFQQTQSSPPTKHALFFLK